MVEPLKIPRHDVVEFAGAMAAASLDEFCGTWMFVNNRGQLTLANICKRPISEDKPVDEQFHAWVSECADERIKPVRRIIQSQRPMLDLLTGAAVRDQGTTKDAAVKAIVQLLQQSRCSLDFLTDTIDSRHPLDSTNEVNS